MGKCKRILKKIINVTLALALLITGIQITPQTVDASMPSSNGKMTYYHISGLSDGCSALKSVWYKSSPTWSNANPKMFLHVMADSSGDTKRTFCMYLGGHAPRSVNGKVYVYKNNSTVAASYSNTIKEYFKSAIYFYYDPDKRWTNFSSDDKYVIAQTYLWRLLKMRSVSGYKLAGNVMGQTYSNSDSFTTTLKKVFKEYKGTDKYGDSVVTAVNELVSMVENKDVRLSETKLYFYHCGTNASQPFLVGTSKSVGSPKIKIKKNVASGTSNSSLTGFKGIDTGSTLGLGQDKTGGLVKGAVYSVKNGSTELGTVTLDKNGEGSLSSNKLKYNQTLTIIEKQAPEGMVKDTTKHKFKIGVSHQTYTINVSDKPFLYPLTIKKVDENGSALANIPFSIYTWNYKKKTYVKVTTSAASNLKTDSNGELKLAFRPYHSNGKVNKIKIVESKALDGYSLAAPKEIIVKDLNKKANTIKFKNEPQVVSLAIIKKDKSSNKLLPGASFIIQKKNSNGTWSDCTKTYTTDATGSVIIKGLRRSTKDGFITYRAHETKAPTNYSISLDGTNSVYSKEFQLRDESDRRYWNGFDKTIYHPQGNGINAHLEYVAKDQIIQQKVNLKVKLTDKNSEKPIDSAIFQLQRCIYNEDGSKTWTDVKNGATKSGIVNFGTINTIDDESTLASRRGTLINYRLVEALPTHYLADENTVKTNGTSIAYSNEFTLPNIIGSYKYSYLTAAASGTTVIATYNAKNELMKANVRIQKTGGYISGSTFTSLNNVYLSNAEYTIYKSDRTTVVTKMYTNMLGSAKSDDIILDKRTNNVFYIQETNPSTGTTPISSSKVKITLNNKDNLVLNGLSNSENITNKDINKILSQNPWSTSFQLKKIDSDTKKALSGVKFRLTTGDRKFIQDFTTNSNGIITIPSTILYYSDKNQGEFQLFEISTLDDYQKSSDVIKIKITGKDTALVNGKENIYKAGSANYYLFGNKQIGGSLTIQKIVSNQLGKQLITGTTNITSTKNTIVDSSLNYSDFVYGLYKYDNSKAGELYATINLKKGTIKVPKTNETAERGIGTLNSIPIGQYMLKEINVGKNYAENDNYLVMNIGTGDNLIYDGELGLSKDNGRTYDSLVFSTNRLATKTINRVSKFVTNAVNYSVKKQDKEKRTENNSNSSTEKRTINDVKKNWDKLAPDTFDKIVVNSTNDDLSHWAKSLNKKEVKTAKLMSNTLDSDKIITTFKDGKATSKKTVNYMTSLLNSKGISTQASDIVKTTQSILVTLKGASGTIVNNSFCDYNNTQSNTIKFTLTRTVNTLTSTNTYTMEQSGTDARIKTAKVEKTGELTLTLVQPAQTKLSVTENKNLVSVVKGPGNRTDICSLINYEAIYQSGVDFCIAPTYSDHAESLGDKLTALTINFNVRNTILAFNANGGVYENTEYMVIEDGRPVYKKGAKITRKSIRANTYPFAFEKPVREGYTFKGYKIEKNQSNTSKSLDVNVMDHPSPTMTDYNYIRVTSDYLVNGDMVTLNAKWEKDEDTLKVEGNVLRNTKVSDQIVIDTIDINGNSITGASFNVSHDGKTSDINDNQILGIKDYDGFINTKKEIKQSIAPYGYTTVNHYPNECKIDTILIPYYANKAGFDCDKGYYVKGRLYKAGDLVRYNNKWYVCTNTNGVVTTASSPSSDEFKEAVDSEYKSKYGLDLGDIKAGASVWNEKVKCVREHIIYYVNEKSGVDKSLMIKKYDPNNNIIDNAGFTLSIKNKKAIATVNSMKDRVNAYVFEKAIKQTDIEQYGTTKSDGSKELTYVVEETTVPFGYKKCDNAEVKAVLKNNEITLYNKNGKVIDDDQPIKLIDENYKLNVTVVKSGVSGASLGGAIYGIFTDSNCTNEVAQVTLDDDGLGTFSGLKLKDYYVKEIKTPDNGLYSIDKTVHKVDTNEIYNNNSHNTSSTFYAYVISKETLKTGSINLIKYLYNDDTKNPGNVSVLPNVRFNAYSLGNKEYIDASKVLYVKDLSEIPSGKTYQTYSDYKKSPNKSVDYIVVTDSILNSLGSAGSTVTDSRGKGSINDLKYGCYILKETSIPAGVEANILEPQIIDLNDMTGSSDNIMKIYNEPFYHSLTIKKIDNNKNPLPNAVFEILDSNKNKVGNNYTTDKNGIITTAPLKNGTYYVREVKAPANCVLDTTERKVTINRAAVNSSDKIEITIINKLTNVKFSKVHFLSLLELTGGKFSIYNSNGEKLYSWTHGNKPYDINGIPKANDTTSGTDYVIYKYVEEEAPNGYLVGDSETFALDDVGNVYTVVYDSNSNIKYTKVSDNTIVMKDRPQVDITVSKYKKNTTTELTGGKFIITDDLGNTIAEWSHNGKPYKISNLRQACSPGEYVNYTLTEVEAPDGYLKAKPIKFAVGYYGSVYKVDGTSHITIDDKHIVMEDNPSNIRVRNVEKNNHNKYVTGAKYTIYDTNDPIDENGNLKEVVNFTTTTKPTEIIGNLSPNHEYCIVAKETPNGYFEAEPITFTIDDDGYVNIKNTETDSYEKIDDNLITIESDFTKVNINVKDKNTKEYIPGATMELFYYPSDSTSGTVSEKTIVARWNTTNEAHYIEKLLPGRYELNETVTTGYVPVQPLTFDVTETGDVQEVTLYNDYTKISFSKINSVTGKFVAGAKVSLYKATVSGTTVTKETKIDSFTTKNTPYERIKLAYGQTYVFVEDEAPYGYTKAADIVFKAGYGTIDITGTKTDNTDITDLEGINGAKEGTQDEITEDTDMEVNADVNDTGKSEDYQVGSDVLEISMIDVPILIDIEKLDDLNKEVYGAKLKVVKLENGNEVKGTAYEWVTDEQGSPQAPIYEDGTYLITETKTPNGHARATDKILTINSGHIEIKEAVTGATLSGTLSSDLTSDNLKLTGKSDTLKVKILDGVIYIDMIDEIMNVFVTNINTKDEMIPGSHFQIKDEDGNVVDDWIQGNEKHIAKELVCGATYTLHEVKPSDGYYSTEDKKFTTKKGDNEVIFRSYPIRIYISKTGTVRGSKQPIANATLQLINTDGVIVKEFISSATDKELITDIPVGEYTLREAKNSSGYNYAKDIKVYIGGNVVNEEFKLNKVKDNINEYKNYKTEEDFITNGYASTQEMFDSKLRVLKTNKYGICLSGAKLQIIKVDNDKETVVKEFTSNSNGNTIDGLKPGDYLLREIEAPDKYDIADDVSFTITGEKDLTVRMIDEPIEPVDTGKLVIPGLAIVILLGGTLLIILRRKRKQIS